MEEKPTRHLHNALRSNNAAPATIDKFSIDSTVVMRSQRSDYGTQTNKLSNLRNDNMKSQPLDGQKIFSDEEKNIVYSALRKIFMSDQFASSERLREFLEFIVVETLEGRGDRIKSYTIAVDVFQKSADFDSTHDPVVRITAGRLRQALDRYYLTEEADNDVKIVLQKGKYVPRFVFSKISMQQKNNTRKPRRKYIYISAYAFVFLIACIILYCVPWREFFSVHEVIERLRKNIVIVVEDTKSNAPLSDGLTAQALTNSLFRQLAAHGSVKIVELRDLQNSDDGVSALKHESENLVILRSELHNQNNGFRVDWRLLDYEDRFILWSDSANFVTGVPNLPNEVASKITSSILGVDGAMSLISSQNFNDTTVDASCVLASRRFLFEYDFVLRQKVQNCLESFSKSHPNNADVWSALSIVYLSLVRYNVSVGEDASSYRDLYNDTLSKIQHLGANTYMGELAMFYAATSRKDIESITTLGRRLLVKYKGDPGLKIRVGASLVSTGQFADGVLILKQAIEQLDTNQGLAFLALAFERYFAGDYRAAIELSRRSGHDEYYLTALIQVVASAETNDADALAIAKARLLSLRPEYEKTYYNDLNERFFDVALIKKIGQSLEKAELVSPIAHQ